jgi:hypothetical protein
VLLACLVGAAQLAACGGADRPSGDDVRDAQKSATQPLYWAGDSVAGLPLTGISRNAGVVTFLYGDCNLPKGEGGCPVPVSVQTASICNVAALFLDVRPTTGRRVRGITARVRGPGTIDLATGTSNVTVRADTPARLERVLPALRPVQGGGAGGDLPQPRYPLAYIEKLRQARDAFVHTGSVRGARNQLRVSQRAIRFRLRLADKLGSARLRRPAREFAGTPCPVEPAS